MASMPAIINTAEQAMLGERRRRPGRRRFQHLRRGVPESMSLANATMREATRAALGHYDA